MQRLTPFLIALTVTAGAAGAQGEDERLEQVEAKLDVLASEVERFTLGSLVPTVGESVFGMGAAASKVYQREDQGVSIGGYGEFLFAGKSGATDSFDAQRVITYIGYKFDDHWVFNSEIEVEHATTSSSSGTTSSSGSTSAEFAYLDYMHSDAVNVRGGLVLVPVGITNELHEPTNFLPASRPQTENRIIPTTWRENGVGVFGDVDGVSYKAFVVNGLNGNEFTSQGLRGGRQKGSRAASEDFGIVVRGDYVGTPGLMIGASLYTGDSGQGTTRSGADLGTTIYEAHVDYKTGPWSFRALGAMADISDANVFNATPPLDSDGNPTSPNLSSEMEGYYAEVGFDLLSGSEKSLTPFVRYEEIDTQSKSPTSAPNRDNEIVTVGINFKPIDQIVIKLDYEDWDGAGDRFNFLIGYVF